MKPCKYCVSLRLSLTGCWPHQTPHWQAAHWHAVMSHPAAGWLRETHTHTHSGSLALQTPLDSLLPTWSRALQRTWNPLETVHFFWFVFIASILSITFCQRRRFTWWKRCVYVLFVFCHFMGINLRLTLLWCFERINKWIWIVPSLIVSSPCALWCPTSGGHCCSALLSRLLSACSEWKMEGRWSKAKWLLLLP